MKFDKGTFKSVIAAQTPENAAIVQSLVDELIFISATLDKLKKTIDTEGATVEKTSGNGFKTVCENPALKGYNTTIKSYNTTCKTLLQYLPEAKIENKPAYNGVTLEQFRKQFNLNTNR